MLSCQQCILVSLVVLSELSVIMSALIDDIGVICKCLASFYLSLFGQIHPCITTINAMNSMYCHCNIVSRLHVNRQVFSFPLGIRFWFNEQNIIIRNMKASRIFFWNLSWGQQRFSSRICFIMISSHFIEDNFCVFNNKKLIEIISWAHCVEFDDRFYNRTS